MATIQVTVTIKPDVSHDRKKVEWRSPVLEIPDEHLRYFSAESYAEKRLEGLVESAIKDYCAENDIPF